ncbi:MAG: hypothetical protein PHE88_05715 [Elusimicrobia bacterium]|nr:hypothetical protein [Elusimicrobiota bacterium]
MRKNAVCISTKAVRFIVLLEMLIAFSNLRLYCETTVVKAITEDSSNGDLSALNETNKKKNKLVHIAIEVLEIRNEAAKTLGVKWIDTVNVGETSVPPTITDIPALFRVGEFGRWTTLSADIKLLVNKGAARLLAKPKIIAKSETNASFFVGGKVPYAIATTNNIQIEWKDYGTQVNLLPTILDDNQIGLSVFADISDLDYTHGTVVSGFSLPALITRKASSSVILKDGETLTLAGLEKSLKEEITSGIPFLSDIPIIGILFSHKSYSNIKTTVVIFITPTIVKEGAPIEKIPF